MRSISIISLAVWFGLATAAGYGVSSWAVGNGGSIPLSGISLTISLAALALILVLLAIPIARYKRKLRAISKKLEDQPSAKITRPNPIDPFYAVRVLVLAKAGAVTASLFAGWHLGVLIKQLNAPVFVSSSLAPNLAAGIVALALLTVSLVVEWMCRLPKDPGDPAAKTDSPVPVQ